MEIIKIIFGKLGAGVLYGIGFFIGLALIGSILMPYFNSRMEEDAEERMSSIYVEYDDDAKLEATVTSENIGGGEFTLLGELANNGEQSWSSITLKAELFDESGAFIEQCEEYIQQTSTPGTKINFKLSCGSSCSAMQIEQYASYKLIVVNAHYKISD